MAASQRLRLGDLRAIFRLLGECRDLGRDPLAWRRHALGGLCRLIGAESANGGEIKWTRREEPLEIILPTDFGFTDGQLALYDEFMRDYGPQDPMITRAMRRMRRSSSTLPRTRLIKERIWQRSDFYTLYREADLRFDLFSISGAGDSVEAMIFHRGDRARDFEERERRLVHLFHVESARLLGVELALARDSPLPGLSPRLRETLDLLLEGEGEKQAAARMGLRASTVHEYVTELYRRIGVSSRAELLARFVRWPRRNEP